MKPPQTIDMTRLASSLPQNETVKRLTDENRRLTDENRRLTDENRRLRDAGEKLEVEIKRLTASVGKYEAENVELLEQLEKAAASD